MCIAEEIVIETRLDRRPDGDLNLAAEKFFHCMRHQVGSRVTVEFQPFRSIQRHQAQPDIRLNRSASIDEILTKVCRDGLARQALTDSNVQHPAESSRPGPP